MRKGKINALKILRVGERVEKKEAHEFEYHDGCANLHNGVR
jgi:hypothetical protein